MWLYVLGKSFVLSRRALPDLIGSSRVHTPLWAGRDDLNTHFTYVEEDSATPDDIATGMMKLVQIGKYTGGTVLLAEKNNSEVPYEGIKKDEIAQKAGIPESKRVAAILQKERGAL